MLRITAFEDGDWRTIPFESLESDFLGICEAHRAQGRALAFAFILFDRSHPYVRSALAQQHYWDALNERAGRHLSVFSLDVRPPSAEPTVQRRWMYRSVVPTYDRINSALSRYFEGLDDATLPCVLFFQVADAQLIDRAVVTLVETDLAATYREIVAVIGAAADAVSRVEDENAQNAQEIFNLITGALRERQERNGLVRLYHVARPVVELVGVIELLRMLLTQ